MANEAPFTPLPGLTVNIAATSSSANVALGTKGTQILVTNLGPNKVFVRLGTGALTASTTADLPVPNGGTALISRSDTTGINDVAAAVCAATETAAVYFTPGYGTFV